jgi:hypothetical protein
VIIFNRIEGNAAMLRIHLLTIYTFSILMLASCGGGSGNENGNVPTTGGGGNTVQASIGSAGGAITSMDGNVTLSVPAGALSSDEMISITPISAADLGD